MSTVRDITEADGWYVGEDKSLVFNLTNGVAAQDITGYTLSFALAEDQFGSSILTKSAALTTPASGIATVTIASADTIGLAAGTYYYRLRQTNSGSRTEWSEGSVVLLESYVD